MRRMSWALAMLALLAALLALGAALEAVLAARDGARFPPPGRMVDIGGRRLHLFCQGPQTSPTVVIEQGAGSPSILWWPVQARVAAFAHVCTYDRAGTLWSDPAARMRSLGDRVADLHAMLTQAKLPGPYILVAHSYGGPLIRLYARRHPGEVAGMVLVDTPEEAVILRPSYAAYARKLGYVAGTLELAARFGLLRLAAGFITTVPDGMDLARFRMLKAQLVRPAFFRTMGDDVMSLTRAPELLRGLGGPGALGDLPLTVITHGIAFPGPAAVLEDGWAEGQRRLAALSTRGELIVAERSNHMIQSDQPDIVVDAIRRVAQRK
jgi:pimeloyl-ACP methyl ester carboxylesterase